jgi:pimeloyl-ACP methyl ester carboxylesterase
MSEESEIVNDAAAAASLSVVAHVAEVATARAPLYTAAFLPALGFSRFSLGRVSSAMRHCGTRLLFDLPQRDHSGLVTSERVLAALERAAASYKARLVLVGHSIGGAITVRWAVRSPEDVAALVLIDAAVAPFSLALWERAALYPFIWALLLDLLGRERLLRRILPARIGDPSRMDVSDIQELTQRLCSATGRALLLAYYRAYLSNGELLASQEALSQLRCPVLILWGQRDGVVPKETLESIRNALPNEVVRQVRVIHDAGHLLPLERPVDVAQAIDDFLRAALE